MFVASIYIYYIYIYIILFLVWFLRTNVEVDNMIMIYIEVRLQGPIVTPKSDGLAAPKFAGLVPI